MDGILVVLQRHENSSSDADNKPYEEVMRTVFRPEQLEDCSKFLEPYYKERPKLLRTWYQHWESQKQGEILLVELDKILFAKNNKWMREALHLSEFAFQTKRRLSGLTAAWSILFMHRSVMGMDWLHGERGCDLVKDSTRVVQNYPQRCDEFVAVTIHNMFDEPVSSRLAPSEVMVYFYVKQNRIDEVS